MRGCAHPCPAAQTDELVWQQDGRPALFNICWEFWRVVQIIDYNDGPICKQDHYLAWLLFILYSIMYVLIFSHHLYIPFNLA